LDFKAIPHDLLGITIPESEVFPAGIGTTTDTNLDQVELHDARASSCALRLWWRRAELARVRPQDPSKPNPQIPDLRLLGGHSSQHHRLVHNPTGLDNATAG